MKKYYAIMLLPLLAVFNGIDYPIGTFNARSDHILVIILSIFLIVKKVINRKKIVFDLLLKLFSLFFLASIISSSFNSPYPNYSIWQTLNYCSVFCTYFLIINAIDDETKLNQFVKYFIIGGILSILYGIVIFIYSVIYGQVSGVNLDTSSAYGIYGIMREPNIFGSYSVIIFAILFNSFLFKKINTHQYPSYKSSGLLLLIAFMGVVLSFTRSAWIALILLVSLSHFINFFKYKSINNYIRFAFISTFMLCLVVLILNSYSSVGFFMYKVQNIINPESDTAFGRIIIWEKALDSYSYHPWIGNGTYSFALLGSPKVLNKATNAWIGNLYLRLLHDSGAIGIILYLTGFLWVIRKGIKSFNILLKNHEVSQSIEILGLVLSIITVLFTFTFTDATSYCFGYLPLAILSVKINIINRKKSNV